MQDTRKLLSLVFVSFWVLSNFSILMLMSFNILEVKIGEDLLKTFNSVTSGFIGIIVGYYFTK